MGNHGVLVAGEDIAQCFDHLYYFERAAQTIIDAYATGKELLIASPEVAEKTAQQWENYCFEFAKQHLSELVEILDREEPEFRS